MSSILKLQYISLCAKVTQELENNVGIRDKVPYLLLHSLISSGFDRVCN